MIIQKNYARLSLSNRSMFDTSYTESFMMKTLNSNWIYWKELNATLKIGTSKKVRSQV